MKIALVHRLLTRQGGVEKNVMLLAEGLASRGHAVTAIVAEARVPAPPGVAVEIVSARGLTRAGRYQAFDRAAAAAVSGNRFDVVQGFDLTTQQDVLRVGRGVKKVYDRVLDRTRGPFDRILRALSPGDRAIARLEDRVFSPSSWRLLVTNCNVVKRELIATYGIDEARIEVVWNGIDLAAFSPEQAREGRGATRAHFGLSPEDRVVLHVGTGFRRKGLDTTLDAFARFAKVDSRARLLVVGRDGALRRYRRLARTLGVADRTTFAGTLPVDAALYGAADVVVLASRYEPFGNVVLEALACGVPAIHTRGGGASEVLAAEGLDELILEEAEDGAGLAMKIGDAISGGEPLRVRSRRAAERHGVGAVISSYEAIYRRVKR